MIYIRHYFAGISTFIVTGNSLLSNAMDKITMYKLTTFENKWESFSNFHDILSCSRDNSSNLRFFVLFDIPRIGNSLLVYMQQYTSRHLVLDVMLVQRFPNVVYHL